MDDLFLSGRIIEVIMVLAVIEAAVLYLFWRRTARGIPGNLLWPNMVAGLSLMLTVYLALTDAWWGWLGLALSVALLAHLADLAMRWRR